MDNDILFLDVNASSTKPAGRNGTADERSIPSSARHVKSNSQISADSYTTQAKPMAHGNSPTSRLLGSNSTNISKTTSNQKYGKANADQGISTRSSRDFEDVSEDDDEGDLNDLYAENMRMISDVHVSGPRDDKHHTDSSKLSKVYHSSSTTALSTNKAKSSVLVSSRNSSDDLTEISSSKMRTSSGDGTNKQAVEKHPLPGNNTQFGDGTKLSDNELIEMLNRPPKTTYALRTKSNFQEFFRGMKSDRMQLLLEKAYEGEENSAKRRDKVEKRMELLHDVLIH